MSDLVIDASLALQWFLEDETARGYRLSVLERLAEERAVVPEPDPALILAVPDLARTYELMSRVTTATIGSRPAGSRLRAISGI